MPFLRFAASAPLISYACYASLPLRFFAPAVDDIYATPYYFDVAALPRAAAMRERRFAHARRARPEQSEFINGSEYRRCDICAVFAARRRAQNRARRRDARRPRSAAVKMRTASCCRGRDARKASTGAFYGTMHTKSVDAKMGPFSDTCYALYARRERGTQRYAVTAYAMRL